MLRGTKETKKWRDKGIYYPSILRGYIITIKVYLQRNFPCKKELIWKYLLAIDIIDLIMLLHAGNK